MKHDDGRKSMRAIAIALACMLLAACGDEEHADIKSWMKEASKDLKGHVPPLPEVKEFPAIAYDAGNLVSPFEAKKIEPDKKAASGGGIKPDLNRRREPLEAYPLESLQMVGSISKQGNTIAIIKADKTTYYVRTGNYMGQNFGVITTVTEGDVTVKELVQDSTGDWIERTSSLQLQER